MAVWQRCKAEKGLPELFPISIMAKTHTGTPMHLCVHKLQKHTHTCVYSLPNTLHG